MKAEVISTKVKVADKRLFEAITAELETNPSAYLRDLVLKELEARFGDHARASKP